jgi:hypothetical protein
MSAADVAALATQGRGLEKWLPALSKSRINGMYLYKKDRYSVNDAVADLCIELFDDDIERSRLVVSIMALKCNVAGF